MTEEKTLVKDDIAKAIYEAHGGLSQREAAEMVDLIFEMLREKLFKEKKVLLSGFGKFEVVKRRSRKIADPNTGEHMVLPERYAVKFKPSQAFIDGVNEE